MLLSQLSYTSAVQAEVLVGRYLRGRPPWIRTTSLRCIRAALYPLELEAVGPGRWNEPASTPDKPAGSTSCLTPDWWSQIDSNDRLCGFSAALEPSQLWNHGAVTQCRSEPSFFTREASAPAATANGTGGGYRSHYSCLEGRYVSVNTSPAWRRAPESNRAERGLQARTLPIGQRVVAAGAGFEPAASRLTGEYPRPEGPPAMRTATEN